MTRLRTAHVSTPRTYRGGENQALLLMRGLRARGHANTLIAPPGSALAERALAEGAAEVVEIPMRSEIDAFSAWRLSRALRRVRADVVQFHDAHALTLGGMGAALAGLRRRVATRRNDYRLGSPWKWRRLAERVIAISATVRDVVVADGVPARKVRVVHSAVNAERVEGGDGAKVRRELGLRDEARVLFCPGAFTHQKGHCFLIDAMARVAARAPEAVLLLAGEGELEAASREQARSLGLLPDRVRFLGWRDDVADLLAASDLFVMASRFEGLCSAALEAMWCRVPVVATDAGGLPEAVGDCGRVVPVGDVEGLARAVVALLENPEEMRRLARRGRERAERLFSADALVEGTLGVYREMVGARTRAGHPARERRRG